MIDQSGPVEATCPTWADLGRVAMGGDGAMLDHVVGCPSCKRYYAEILALDTLLELAGPEIFDTELAGVPEVVHPPHVEECGRAGRQYLRHGALPGVRAAAIAAVVLFGLATMFGEGVAPITTPSAANWRGAPLDAIDAVARWSPVTRSLEISWLRRAGDELFVVRVWRSDGVLVVKTSTPEDRVRFDATEWRGRGDGPFLWSVEVWAGGKQVATSTLREIELDGQI